MTGTGVTVCTVAGGVVAAAADMALQDLAYTHSYLSLGAMTLGGAFLGWAISSSYTEGAYAESIKSLYGDILKTIDSLVKPPSFEESVLTWCNDNYEAAAPLVEGFYALCARAKNLKEAIVFLDILIASETVSPKNHEKYKGQKTEVENIIKQIANALKIIREQPKFAEQHRIYSDKIRTESAKDAAKAAQRNADANQLNALATVIIATSSSSSK
jgi:hypothetical protein